MGRIRKNVQNPRAPVSVSPSNRNFSDTDTDSGSDVTVPAVDVASSSKAASPSTSQAKQSPASSSSKKAAKRRRQKKSHWEKLATGILWYSFDVLVKILALLKWPIAIFLTIYLGRFLLFQSLNRVAGALQAQVRTGVCSIPFAASIVQTSLPGFCSPIKNVDFSEIIDMQRGAMETASLPVYSGSLPLQLKKAELATSDLRTVLQQSELSCKETLDSALQAFSSHARDSSRAIQKTVVRVRGMVDAQLAMNEWAITALSRIEDRTSMLGSVVPFFGTYDSRVSVTRTYIHAMDELSEYVRRLIEANEQAYQSLDYLEEDLHLIHEITGLEKQFQKTGQDEVLSSLWSLLGGNKKAKKLFRENLKVLGDFERGRLADKEVVAATSVAFTKMMLQIEYMREQIQRPGLSREDVPIEMHIRNIELGIENLRSNKAGHKDTLDDDLKGLLD